MKTQSNSMLIGKLHKQIADVQSKLEEKQGLYIDALKNEISFDEIKELNMEMRRLKQSLKHLEAQIIIYNYLDEHSN